MQVPANSNSRRRQRLRPPVDPKFIAMAAAGMQQAGRLPSADIPTAQPDTTPMMPQADKPAL